MTSTVYIYGSGFFVKNGLLHTTVQSTHGTRSIVTSATTLWQGYAILFYIFSNLTCYCNSSLIVNFHKSQKRLLHDKGAWLTIFAILHTAVPVDFTHLIDFEISCVVSNITEKKGASLISLTISFLTWEAKAPLIHSELWASYILHYLLLFG